MIREQQIQIYSLKVRALVSTKTTPIRLVSMGTFLLQNKICSKRTKKLIFSFKGNKTRTFSRINKIQILLNVHLMRLTIYLRELKLIRLTKLSRIILISVKGIYSWRAKRNNWKKKRVKWEDHKETYSKMLKKQSIHRTHLKTFSKTQNSQAREDTVNWKK